MRKRKLLSLLVLLMTAWSGVRAADPELDYYVAAMAAIQDGADYLIKTEVNGTTYYVTTAGLFTTVKKEAGVFHITQTLGGHFGRGFRIYTGTECFTNPPKDGDKANLNITYFARDTKDRPDWERQILYLNGDGKFAIRSCNTEYGESGWNDTGRTFWS